MSNSFICPVCGEEVKTGAKSCPECGACDETGWKQEYLESEYVYDGLDLADDEFDYNEFINREFGGKTKKSGKEWIFAALAVIVIIIWILFYIL